MRWINVLDFGQHPAEQKLPDMITKHMNTGYAASQQYATANVRYTVMEDSLSATSTISHLEFETLPLLHCISECLLCLIIETTIIAHVQFGQHRNAEG